MSEINELRTAHKSSREAFVLFLDDCRGVLANDMVARAFAEAQEEGDAFIDPATCNLSQLLHFVRHADRRIISSPRAESREIRKEPDR